MLERKAVNTGRQIEFDYMKGWFTPMILLIHSFQMLVGAGEHVDGYKILYIIATMTGSAIFMFVLGLGSVYSRRTNTQLVKDGAKLLLWQVLWNVFAMAVPMLLAQILRGLFGCATDWPTTWMFMPTLFQYVNVFFIAGMCYFLLAVLRWMKTPAWAYFALACLFIVVNPYLYLSEAPTGIAVLDYVITCIAGGRPEVSLCCLAHFPYVLCGAGFGKVLRCTTDKKSLYKRIAFPAALVVASYFVYACHNNKSLDALFIYISDEYVFPGTLRALANCSSILLMAGALYALSSRIANCRPLNNMLIHFCKMTTPYYAVHPFFYSFFTSLALFHPYSAAACVGMTFVVWALSFATILAWNRLCVKYKQK